MTPDTRRLASAALVLAACAASRPSLPAPAPASPKLLPRSSVAAVLAHRGELRLDDDQVRRLEAIDDDLQLQDARLLVGSSSVVASEGGGPPPGSPPGSPARPLHDGPPAGARPGPDESPAGEPMGRHGRGHREAREPKHGSERPPAIDLEKVRNDNDTAAYFRAEEILRPDQRERAREFAEQYREDLYDQRHPVAR